VPALLRFSGAVERDPAIDKWFDQQPSELRSIARTWFTLMRQCGTDVRELMHDGCPVACVEDHRSDTSVPSGLTSTLGFFHGAALTDPAGLLEGTGKYMRHVKAKPGLAFDVSSLEALITAAYQDIGARLRVAK